MRFKGLVMLAVAASMLPSAVSARPAASAFTVVLSVLKGGQNATVAVSAHTRIGSSCMLNEVDLGTSKIRVIGDRLAVGQTGIVQWSWWQPARPAGSIAMVTCDWRDQVQGDELGIPLGAVPIPKPRHVEVAVPTAVPPSAAPPQLHVAVDVSPNPMPYDTFPTLTATTSPGASCQPSVVYSTGRPPKSLVATTQVVPASGTVSWNWHEETKGISGTATVDCTLGTRSAEGSASFSVD